MGKIMLLLFIYCIVIFIGSSSCDVNEKWLSVKEVKASRPAIGTTSRVSHDRVKRAFALLVPVNEEDSSEEDHHKSKRCWKAHPLERVSLTYGRDESGETNSRSHRLTEGDARVKTTRIKEVQDFRPPGSTEVLQSSYNNEKRSIERSDESWERRKSFEDDDAVGEIPYLRLAQVKNPRVNLKEFLRTHQDQKLSETTSTESKENTEDLIIRKIKNHLNSNDYNVLALVGKRANYTPKNEMKKYTCYCKEAKCIPGRKCPRFTYKPCAPCKKTRPIFVGGTNSNRCNCAGDDRKYDEKQSLQIKYPVAKNEVIGEVQSKNNVQPNQNPGQSSSVDKSLSSSKVNSDKYFQHFNEDGVSRTAIKSPNSNLNSPELYRLYRIQPSNVNSGTTGQHVNLKPQTTSTNNDALGSKVSRPAATEYRSGNLRFMPVHNAYNQWTLRPNHPNFGSTFSQVASHYPHQVNTEDLSTQYGGSQQIGRFLGAATSKPAMMAGFHSLPNNVFIDNRMNGRYGNVYDYYNRNGLRWMPENGIRAQGYPRQQDHSEHLKTPMPYLKEAANHQEPKTPLIPNHDLTSLAKKVETCVEKNHRIEDEQETTTQIGYDTSTESSLSSTTRYYVESDENDNSQDIVESTSSSALPPRSRDQLVHIEDHRDLDYGSGPSEETYRHETFTDNPEKFRFSLSANDNDLKMVSTESTDANTGYEQLNSEIGHERATHPGSSATGNDDVLDYRNPGSSRFDDKYVPSHKVSSSDDTTGYLINETKLEDQVKGPLSVESNWDHNTDALTAESVYEEESEEYEQSDMNRNLGSKVSLGGKEEPRHRYLETHRNQPQYFPFSGDDDSSTMAVRFDDTTESLIEKTNLEAQLKEPTGSESNWDQYNDDSTTVSLYEDESEEFEQTNRDKNVGSNIGYTTTVSYPRNSVPDRDEIHHYRNPGTSSIQSKYLVPCYDFQYETSKDPPSFDDMIDSLIEETTSKCHLEQSISPQSNFNGVSTAENLYEFEPEEYENANIDNYSRSNNEEKIDRDPLNGNDLESSVVQQPKHSTEMNEPEEIGGSYGGRDSLKATSDANSDIQVITNGYFTSKAYDDFGESYDKEVPATGLGSIHTGMEINPRDDTGSRYDFDQRNLDSNYEESYEESAENYMKQSSPLKEDRLRNKNLSSSDIVNTSKNVEEADASSQQSVGVYPIASFETNTNLGIESMEQTTLKSQLSKYEEHDDPDIEEGNETGEYVDFQTSSEENLLLGGSGERRKPNLGNVRMNSVSVKEEPRSIEAVNKKQSYPEYISDNLDADDNYDQYSSSEEDASVLDQPDVNEVAKVTGSVEHVSSLARDDDGKIYPAIVEDKYEKVESKYTDISDKTTQDNFAEMEPIKSDEDVSYSDESRYSKGSPVTCSDKYSDISNKYGLEEHTSGNVYREGESGDVRVEDSPTKYFSPNDRVLEYIKTHSQNLVRYSKTHDNNQYMQPAPAYSTFAEREEQYRDPTMYHARLSEPRPGNDHSEYEENNSDIDNEEPEDNSFGTVEQEAYDVNPGQEFEVNNHSSQFKYEPKSTNVQLKNQQTSFIGRNVQPELTSIDESAEDETFVGHSAERRNNLDEHDPMTDRSSVEVTSGDHDYNESKIMHDVSNDKFSKEVNSDERRVENSIEGRKINTAKPLVSPGPEVSTEDSGKYADDYEESSTIGMVEGIQHLGNSDYETIEVSSAEYEDVRGSSESKDRNNYSENGCHATSDNQDESIRTQLPMYSSHYTHDSSQSTKSSASVDKSEGSNDQVIGITHISKGFSPYDYEDSTSAEDYSLSTEQYDRYNDRNNAALITGRTPAYSTRNFAEKSTKQDYHDERILPPNEFLQNSHDSGQHFQDSLHEDQIPLPQLKDNDERSDENVNVNVNSFAIDEESPLSTKIGDYIPKQRSEKISRPEIIEGTDANTFEKTDSHQDEDSTAEHSASYDDNEKSPDHVGDERMDYTSTQSRHSDEELDPSQDTTSREIIGVTKPLEGCCTKPPEMQDDVGYLGRLKPKQSKSKVDSLEDLIDSDLFYIGDGVRLPLTIKKLKDGSFALSISDKICEKRAEKKCPCCVPREGKILQEKRHGNENEERGEKSKTINLRRRDINEDERNGHQTSNIDDHLRRMTSSNWEKVVADTQHQNKRIARSLTMPVDDFAAKYNLVLNLEDQQLSEVTSMPETSLKHNVIQRDETSGNTRKLNSDLMHKLVSINETPEDQRSKLLLTALEDFITADPIEAGPVINGIREKLEGLKPPEQSADEKLKGRYGYQRENPILDRIKIIKQLQKDDNRCRHKYQKDCDEAITQKTELLMTILHWLKALATSTPK